MICRVQNVGELRCGDFSSYEGNELMCLARVSIKWVVGEIEGDDVLVLNVVAINLEMCVN